MNDRRLRTRAAGWAERVGCCGAWLVLLDELLDLGVVVDGDADFEGAVEGADVVHEGGDFDFGEVCFEA